VSILVRTFGTGKLGEERLVELIREHFDLTPKGIMEQLDLRRPIYRQTATYGHFGRSEPGFSWESTRVAERLQRAVGV
jgi:S-adenosylmethionine synthetase